MQVFTKLYTNFILFIMYGRIVSRPYGHFQSSCLPTTHCFFLTWIALFKNHPVVVLHSRNPTHPWNNSVIETFPGSVQPTTWPPTSQTFLSVYTKNHIHCIPLLGTLHKLSAGSITTVATTETAHVHVMQGHHLKLENAVEDITHNDPHFTLTDLFLKYDFRRVI
jgi:hypothetical protein